MKNYKKKKKNYAMKASNLATKMHLMFNFEIRNSQNLNEFAKRHKMF